MKFQFSNVPIKHLKVENRFRKVLAGIDALAASIKKVGLLHPLVVDENYNVIAGSRRLAAVKKLGWEHVDCHFCSNVNDAVKALIAERDENTCRQQLTPSESVALGKAIEAIEAGKALIRRQQNLFKRQNSGTSETDARENGRTDDKVAAAVGMGRTTYRQAKEVVNAAEANPSLNGVVKEMDVTGKVAPAHRKVTAAKAKPSKNGETYSGEEFEKILLRMVQFIDKVKRLDGGSDAWNDLHKRLHEFERSWARYQFQREKKK